MIPGDFTDKKTIPTENLNLTEFADKAIEVDVLRLDKIHPVVSGNKWFKLKNYMRDAAEKQYKTIITFGGAYSNHIVATAYAAKQSGFKSIGIIRGERSVEPSHTLTMAGEYGMKLRFINRRLYRELHSSDLPHEWLQKYPEAYFIPEGGQGLPGIRGCEEILDLTQKSKYTHICCAIGTGAMYTGLVNASEPGQYIIGISVLRGMTDLVQKFQRYLNDSQKINHCQIQYDYHFGGYAKRKPELIDFMNRLYADSGIPTDFVYTAKMFFAAADLATKNHFLPESKLLLIHSGGLQGNLSLPPGTLNF
jgi:1-aminocyclopropane-1-carboxylate deaminase/D-cysteine desulfhydrase-like pyridoxal-dependent ACC family enzyme